MTNLANILLFVGNILIAFEIIGEIGYIQSLLGLLFVSPIHHFLNQLTETPENKSTLWKIGYCSFLLIITGLLIMVAIALSPFLLAMFVGKIFLAINLFLNELLLVLLRQWKEFYFASVRQAVKGRKTKFKPTDNKLWRIAEEHKVPFVALLGVLFLIAGFIIQLLN
jgi:hypothetical protein